MILVDAIIGTFLSLIFCLFIIGFFLFLGLPSFMLMFSPVQRERVYSQSNTKSYNYDEDEDYY